MLSLLFLLLSVVSLTALFRYRVAQRVGERKREEDSRALMSAHSIANAWKADVYRNFTRYRQKAPGWEQCGQEGIENRTFSEFLEQFLSDEKRCAYQMDHFITGLEGDQTLAVGDVLRTPLLFRESLNRFVASIRIVESRSHRGRSEMVGEITLRQSDPSFWVRQYRMVMDVGLTVEQEQTKPECRLCRAIPGSVCCGTEWHVTYFDVSGEVVDVIYDEALGGSPERFVRPYGANPVAMGIKNLPLSGTPEFEDYYTPYNLCHPLTSCPTRYLLDAASDGLENYYLTIHGKVIDGAGNDIYYDPKLLSLAYEGGRWFLLLNGGTVTWGLDLRRGENFLPIRGLHLPTAISLAMGQGPVP